MPMYVKSTKSCSGPDSKRPLDTNGETRNRTSPQNRTMTNSLFDECLPPPSASASAYAHCPPPSALRPSPSAHRPPHHFPSPPRPSHLPRRAASIACCFRFASAGQVAVVVGWRGCFHCRRGVCVRGGVGGCCRLWREEVVAFVIGGERSR